jgi:hypothetical protein
VIGPRQLTSRTLRALNLDPERAAANAAPSAAQRRRDRADQLAAILRRYNTRGRPVGLQLRSIHVTFGGFSSLSVAPIASEEFRNVGGQ